MRAIVGLSRRSACWERRSADLSKPAGHRRSRLRAGGAPTPLRASCEEARRISRPAIVVENRAAPRTIAAGWSPSGARRLHVLLATIAALAITPHLNSRCRTASGRFRTSRWRRLGQRARGAPVGAGEDARRVRQEANSKRAMQRHVGNRQPGNLAAKLFR